jgi:SAM-dependent methyltransferase
MWYRLCKRVREQVIMHEKDFWQIVAQGLVRSDFEWLEPLRAVVSSLIVFGCWDDGDTVRQCREPYVLLRILGATRAVVVDKEAEYLWNAQCWFQETQAEHPELFGACDLEFVVSDMTGQTNELPVNGFDLAYCSGVLYFMRADAGNLQASINTMARVVKPGGSVIANEDEGLKGRFEEAGLEEAVLDNAPEYAYCYRKPLDAIS